MDVREEGKPFSATGTSGIGCLVMQGFTGTVGSIRYYADTRQEGSTIEAPRLTVTGPWQDVNKLGTQMDPRCGQLSGVTASCGRCSSRDTHGQPHSLSCSAHPEIAGVIPVNAPSSYDKRAPFCPS